MTRSRRPAAIGLSLLAASSLGPFVSDTRAAAPSPPQLLASAAQAVGIRRCLPAITAIARRATRGATLQDIMLDWNHQAPDAAPLFSLIGLGAGPLRAAVTLTAVPLETNSCSVLVERISATSQSCASVAASELPHDVSTQLIDGVRVYQNPAQPAETYTLVSGSNACLVIRRQAIFQWPPKS